MNEEQTNQVVNPEGSNEATGGQQQSQTPEAKTYSQEDVNNVVAKETRKATEKLLQSLGVEDFNGAKEGLAKLKEWQESQKSEAQKQAETLENLKGENASLSEQVAKLTAVNKALGLGVKAEAVDDVVTLAEKLVSEDVTVEQALGKVLEKYPQFGGKTEVEEKTPTFVAKGSPVVESGTKFDPFKAVMDAYK